jgi:aspartate aminotransferase-like enzyme
MNACFLTGPVALRPAVRAAFQAAPISHRDAAFLESLRRTHAALLSLVNAQRVALMVGSGTLANDAVGAQLAGIGGPGLILSNGEFGDRLIDHASRWNLAFTTERLPWGQWFDWQRLRRTAAARAPRWIWAVLNETSTGVANPLAELLALSHVAGADLCVDAVSAIGLMPVDLQGVRLATAVSGKGLAAYPGLAAVFHDGRLVAGGRIPRYLDLAAYEANEGVPFTHSSNLVAALETSLSATAWSRKYERVRLLSRRLREELRGHSLPPLADDEHASPGIITVPMPDGVSAAAVARALAQRGIEIAWQSGYLRERNWLQIALMGEVDELALQLLPDALAAAHDALSAAARGPGHPASLPSAVHSSDRRPGRPAR